MRRVLVLVAALAGAAPAFAQTETSAPQDAALREGLAVGGLIAPALEGGGPWLMPAIRLSVPLGSRHGFDVETGRVFGGSDPRWGSIRRYSSVQLRFQRQRPEGSEVARYWLAGLQHLPETEADGRRKNHTALVIGHGWSQAYRSGARLLSEIGFAGGDGFMFFVNAGVQWGPPGKRKS